MSAHALQSAVETGTSDARNERQRGSSWRPKTREDSVLKLYMVVVRGGSRLGARPERLGLYQIRSIPLLCKQQPIYYRSRFPNPLREMAPSGNIHAFQDTLHASRNIIAVAGAGLSAASGEH